MMSYIYIVTNLINRKAYVGQHDGSKRHYYTSGICLKNAIKKYGKHNFKREKIIEGHFNQELLDLLEQEAIDKYQTYAYKFPDKGYNLTIGGSGRRGSKQNEDTKLKIRHNSPNRKVVNQFTLKGFFIRSFHSAQEAQRITGIQGPSITRCCNQEMLTAGGFLWSYTNEATPIAESYTVFQYSLSGELIGKYRSMAEAARLHGMLYTSISNAINISGQAGGFQWRKEKLDRLSPYTKLTQYHRHLNAKKQPGK